MRGVVERATGFGGSDSCVRCGQSGGIARFMARNVPALRDRVPQFVRQTRTDADAAARLLTDALPGAPHEPTRAIENIGLVATRIDGAKWDTIRSLVYDSTGQLGAAAGDVARALAKFDAWKAGTPG